MDVVADAAVAAVEVVVALSLRLRPSQISHAVGYSVERSVVG